MGDSLSYLDNLLLAFILGLVYPCINYLHSSAVIKLLNFEETLE